MDKTDLIQPLRDPIFRRVWISGLFSNVGTFIQAVAAAWAMAELTRSETMVALVQTASMLPMMLFAILAGTLADIYDRRLVAILALVFATLGAGALAISTALGFATPALLLVLTFLLACGTSVYAPTWQALSREQVHSRDLTSVIALNSMSYNVGRSVGPAVGGILVAVAGVAVAFTVNALSFLPILLVLLLWRREDRERAPPRDLLMRAVGLGLNYVWHSPAIRVALIRTVATVLCSSALLALLPLIAQRRMGGDASVYGILLASFGFGAIFGTTVVTLLQSRIRREVIIRLAAGVAAVGLLVVAFSRSVPLSVAALVPVGGAWTTLTCAFNVSVQLPAPGWMTARAVSSYQMCVGAGVALGGLLWGSVASSFDAHTALAIAALCLIMTIGMGFVAPIPELAVATEGEPPQLRQGLPAIDGARGPVTILVEYELPPARIDEFLDKVAELRQIRLRNGASRWHLSRELESDLWLERFSFPTWHDFLQYRGRVTIGERGFMREAYALPDGVRERRVRYLIEERVESRM